MDSKLENKVKPIESWGRCWALVTGASCGIGAALCVRLAKEFPSNSVIVGIARNKDGLNATAEMIKQSSESITFIPYSMDLESASEMDYSSMIKTVFDKLSERTFDRFVIVHNAGSLGELNYLKNITDASETNKYFSLNIGSVISLNGCLLKFLRQVLGDHTIHVINISSLAAIQPIKSWGLYCAGKAARDMAMTVLAIEEKDLNVLNYSPGPIATAMQVKARNHTADGEVRSAFENMKTEGTLVKMDDSMNKLIRIMKQGNYISGAHIDYFTEL